MHIITRKRLLEFAARHPGSAAPLDVWYRLVKSRRYSGPEDVRRDFGSASFLAGHRVVFNIAGNKYRLGVTMRYDMGRCFIRWVETHAGYDRRTRDGTL
jgi:mRNA interferase HigB